MADHAFDREIAVLGKRDNSVADGTTDSRHQRRDGAMGSSRQVDALGKAGEHRWVGGNQLAEEVHHNVAPGEMFGTFADAEGSGGAGAPATYSGRSGTRADGDLGGALGETVLRR